MQRTISPLASNQSFVSVLPASWSHSFHPIFWNLPITRQIFDSGIPLAHTPVGYPAAESSQRESTWYLTMRWSSFVRNTDDILSRNEQRFVGQNSIENSASRRTLCLVQVRSERYSPLYVYNYTKEWFFTCESYVLILKNAVWTATTLHGKLKPYFDFYVPFFWILNNIFLFQSWNA